MPSNHQQKSSRHVENCSEPKVILSNILVNALLITGRGKMAWKPLSGSDKIDRKNGRLFAKKTLIWRQREKLLLSSKDNFCFLPLNFWAGVFQQTRSKGKDNFCQSLFFVSREYWQPNSKTRRKSWIEPAIKFNVRRGLLKHALIPNQTQEGQMAMELHKNTILT